MHSLFLQDFRAQCRARIHGLGRIPSAVVSPLFTVVAFFFFFASLSISNPVGAASSGNSRNLFDQFRAVPSEYGEVIYRINEDSPKQLYIIGISHRDPDNGSNNSNTVQTQAEIYRIGEWLNRNMDLELVLPEGFFSDRESTEPLARAISIADAKPRISTLHLLERLADESCFVNAEMLLVEHNRMHASQVEDRRIYDAVRSSLGKLRKENDRSAAADIMAELRYLQEIRTAMLLQKIPAVIEYELLNGAIRNSSAMFTIGLNHIQDIIRYLEDNTIRIDAPSFAMQAEPYSPDLNLLKQGYGITVIIPRTLADNRKVLKLTNLDRILVAEGAAPVNN